MMPTEQTTPISAKKTALCDINGFYVHHLRIDNQFFFSDKMFKGFPFVNGVYGFPIVRVFEKVATYEIKGYFR